MQGRRPQSWLIIVAIIFLAANLRPAITGVGPLISAITRGTGLTPGVAGLVTTLPLISFGVVSPLAPKLARKLGIERTLFLSLAVLLAGTLIRAIGTAPWLLAGMLLAGAGIAVGNVLMPSLVKRDFPERIGLMTGLYTTVMNVFAGLASGLSVPLSHHWGLGWQGSLAAWGALGVLGLIVWLPHLSQRHLPSAARAGGFWRSPLAWEMTLFMGLQSFLFYVNVAWLPTLLHDRGLSLNLAGWLVSLMQIISLPGTFVVPILAGRQRQQVSLVLAVALAFFVGYLGLLVTTNEAATIICLVLVGFGAGASISLALALFSLRTRHHEHAGQISGMAQSVGYLLAGLGPLTVGYLHTATQSWTGPLLLLLVVVVLMAVSGVGAGRDRFVDAPGESSAEAL